MSFRREKYVPRGGPNGGAGGDGGHVLIKVTDGLDNLAHLRNRKFWRAKPGGPGLGSNKTGPKGAQLVIPIPAGTIVRDREGGHILKDLKYDDDEVIAARGGQGGKGNRHFATATNRAPRDWEPGGDGEGRWVVLELKVIADVGLIGLPNAGKSTLLSRISRAQPEIADYPFTTKYPNLGLVYPDPDRSIVVADIPGLIEGAHAGVGLGHEFLRHVERTRVLVHMVAPTEDFEEMVGNYHSIRKELELFNPTLASKPELVVMTKLDVVHESDYRERFEAALGKPVRAISAVTGEGLSKVVNEAYQLVQSAKAEEVEA